MRLTTVACNPGASSSSPATSGHFWVRPWLASKSASVEALQSERAKPLRAPLIIVVAARPTVGHKVPVAEQVAAVSACVQNMSLAAAALGFAANWKTGPAAEAEEVKDTLGLATDDTIVALLYLGTPDGTPPPYEPTLDGRVSIL